ncbi:hypothetical protein [Candidatus Poriferisodalis sp.]|uniref:hypothetical protein n=1 Tax=Candidatus Poriferisodalis sp. TaxID=3101277 RepID=UPI003B51F2AD
MPIVVGSDAAAQSDIYSAVTLAGVVGTDCLILAGPRDGAMPASQRARLNAAADGGFVLGGIAAVPTAKIEGRDMTRLGGETRWATAQLVGRRASGDAAAGTSTAAEPTVEETEAEESEGEETRVEGSQEGIPDPVQPNQAFLAYREEARALFKDCREGDANKCDMLVQLKSDFLGCEFSLERGLCQGYSYDEYWALVSSLACPEGWTLGNTSQKCYHPDLYE